MMDVKDWTPRYFINKFSFEWKLVKTKIQGWMGAERKYQKTENITQVFEAHVASKFSYHWSFRIGVGECDFKNTQYEPWS